MTPLSAPPVSLQSWLARALGLLAALLFFAAGWALVADQSALLWKRLPAQAADRYAADRIATPLPRLPAVAEIKAACAQPLSWRTEWRRKWLREELAACLANPAALVQGAAAEQVVARFEKLIQTQMDAAQGWLAVHDRTLSAERDALAQALRAAQAQPPALVAKAAQWVGRVRPATPDSVRQPVGAPPAPEAVGQVIRSQLAATRTLLADLALQPMPQRLKGLALAATGLQLVADYETSPPQMHLATDRRSLADTLEWQRRARSHQERGFDLATLQQLPVALFAGSVLLVLAAALASRGSALTVAAWALATQLLGLGALLLTDLALTGDPSLRYLAQRQLVSFGLGDATLPLLLVLPLPGPDGATLALWWPLVGVALAVLALGMVRTGGSLWLAPVRLWVRGGAMGLGGAVQSALLVVLGMALVLFLGMPAAVSELLILLGCVGVASYVARQAPLANAGAGLQIYNLAVVSVALLVSVGASLYRGDLGHALVALLLAACFAWLFGWRWLRWAVVGGAALMAGLLVQCLMAGALVGPLGWLARHLPPHAQDRFAAMFDPFHAGSSDLARTRWLMDSAGTEGWGLGYVPWQGLASARAHEALPLQGPSDYVLALVVAVWGKAGGLALMGLVLVLFGAAAALGLRTALRPAMPLAVRWLGAVGGFGCMVMAAKVVLSVGGVSGVLPLTGLPVSLLGYGPMTHLAALVYLALALGAAHVVPVELQRGVNVGRQAPLSGAVRQRGVLLGAAALAALGALLGLAYAHLAQTPADNGRRHLAQARLDMAQAVSAALVPVDVPVETTAGAVAWPCPELAAAVAAWNERIAALPKAVRVSGGTVATGLRLDAARLLSQPVVGQAYSCRDSARTLGRMIDTDLQRLLGREVVGATAGATPARAKDPMAHRLASFDKPRMVGARPLDYATPNVWWGQPGCLAAPGAAQCEPNRLDATSTDIWLDRQLAPQVHLALRSPAGTSTVNHHAVAVGPTLGLTLDPGLQAVAQRLADCATARQVGSACQDVWPTDGKWRELHYQNPNALRTGAIGITLARVDTGRVVAMAGAVSDCTLDHLARKAVPDANGKLPAVRGNARCAQLPDQRSAWLAQQHPALWMVPPGSALKPFSLVAGMDAGVLFGGDDAYWKGILAESHERLPIQRTALAAGPRYLNVLHGVGFGAEPAELLWGGPAAQTPKGQTRWATERYAGTSGLRATAMTLDRAEQIRREKLAGVNVDKRYGEAVTREFMAARSLADASVGGGDIRINALGLLDAWRALDLRARGHVTMPALHLLEQGGRTPAPRDLGFMSQAAAARALGMTSGVAASAWKGTAQGSCRVVYGACPAQGVPGLSGKTGSSDFLLQEDSPWVKPGMQVPAKLFGGVFTGADGQRYAVAVMALRVREGDTRTLELKPSAPAEAAFTVMRQMGVASGAAAPAAPVLTKPAPRRPSRSIPQLPVNPS